MTYLMFRHLLESTLVCVVLGSLTYGLRRQAAAVRHSIWLLSILKFSIPTVFLTATGAWMAFALPVSAWTSSLAAKLSAVLASLFNIWFERRIGTGDSIFAFVTVLAIWLPGSAILFAAWITRWRKSYQSLSTAPNRAQAVLDEAAQRLRFRAYVKLRCCEPGHEPTLIGIFRPLIVIPQGLPERLTEAELEAVLVHELAHARRRDNLTAAFVHSLACVFWFHPLLWFVEKKLLAERERACDETVIESGIPAETYLAGLAKVCQFHVLGEVKVAGVSAANGSDLGSRFDQILHWRTSNRIPYVARLVIAAVALFMTVLPVAGGYCEQCVSQGRGITTAGQKHRTRIIQPLSPK